MEQQQLGRRGSQPTSGYQPQYAPSSPDGERLKTKRVSFGGATVIHYNTASPKQDETPIRRYSHDDVDRKPRTSYYDGIDGRGKQPLQPIRYRYYIRDGDVKRVEVITAR